MRIRPIRLDTEARSASRSAFEEGGRYLGIPGNETFSRLTTVQETGCGTEGDSYRLREKKKAGLLSRKPKGAESEEVGVPG